MSSGPAALLQADLQHNIALPAVVAKPSIGQMKGSAIANPDPSNYDHEYLVPVTIGTVTPQTIDLDLDTGSSDLYVGAFVMRLWEEANGCLQMSVLQFNPYITNYWLAM